MWRTRSLGGVWERGGWGGFAGRGSLNRWAACHRHWFLYRTSEILSDRAWLVQLVLTCILPQAVSMLKWHRHWSTCLIDIAWMDLAHLVSINLLGWYLRLRPGFCLRGLLVGADRRHVTGWHCGRGLAAHCVCWFWGENLFLLAIRHHPAKTFPLHICGWYGHPLLIHLAAFCLTIDCNSRKWNDWHTALLNFYLVKRRKKTYHYHWKTGGQRSGLFSGF